MLDNTGWRKLVKVSLQYARYKQVLGTKSRTEGTPTFSKNSIRPGGLKRLTLGAYLGEPISN